MIPTHRPKPWYGPDDYDGYGDHTFESAKRDLEIAAWDIAKAERLRSMSLWQRIVYALFYSSDTMP